MFKLAKLNSMNFEIKIWLIIIIYLLVVFKFELTKLVERNKIKNENEKMTW